MNTTFVVIMVLFLAVDLVGRVKENKLTLALIINALLLVLGFFALFT